MSQQTDNVILLHGFGRTSRAMSRIAFELNKDYTVINKTYPSRKHSIERLADLALSAALEECNRNQQGKIHFVTHSLGGILLRYYLEHRQIENLGRTVMLGPPNQGTELSDFLNRIGFVERVIGPASLQLGTSDQNIPKQLGAVNFELGIIAGTKHNNPIFASLIEGENDGKISVANSKVAGMKDHLVLPVTHTFMMQNKTVIDQVKYFLENGRFDH